MDLASASGLRRRLATSCSPTGQREIARSPPRRSPSLSRSSPSSDQSSPSSTSSSPRANSSFFPNHVKGQTHESELLRVSSTSASRTKSSLSTAKATFAESFPRSLSQSGVEYQEVGRKKEIYDPFHPTEGEKDGKTEEDEGEKYDPFEPTGSPASDDDDEDGNLTEKLTSAQREIEKKEEEPPDSTDVFSDPPSPPLAPQLSHRRRVDYSTTKARVKRERADSDHSEIEEGEIVVAIERDVGTKRTAAENLLLDSPKVTFFDPKPERILRVLDGDGFVSVCADSNWDVDRETDDEPRVGVEDLRRKLVSKRKERYLAFPGSSPLTSELPPPLPPPPPVDLMPSSPLAPAAEKGNANRKSSKAPKDQSRQRSKDTKAREKDEKRKKKRKDKEGDGERSREKKPGDKTDKDGKSRRGSRSSSQKRKKTHHSSPEASQSHNSSRRDGHRRHSYPSPTAERHRERERDKERDRDRGRDGDRSRKMERDRYRESERSRTFSQRRDERERRSSSRKDERKRKGLFHSSSRERDVSKRPRRSGEKREGERAREHERDRRREGRPVVPPSIQDLNGSDLFAIKRTITVTTTTTTTTVPGSPILTQASPCRIVQDTPHKRKKKRRWHSGGEEMDRGTCRSRSQSPSPPRYRRYESDRYSDKLEIDVLSLDGEALDSDYPSLEDTPPAALPPDPPVPSPKSKPTPKTERHHPKKKGHTSKKLAQSSSSSSSSSNKTKSKCLSSLSVTSDSAPVPAGLPLAKRTRKVGKDKAWDKDGKKDLGRSGKSKKESSSRKAKLQSKVSVLVREGVSSTTGTSIGSGKLGMDLLGPGATGGGSGGSVVGGSIAVVFCRDNESRSPFLKPCTEPLSVGVRNKELASMGKRNSLAAPPPSLNSTGGVKSKKTKAGSITSTSSSTPSPSSTLATKRRRRLAKKVRAKDGASGLDAGDGSQTKVAPEGWSGAPPEVLSAAGDGSKAVSPHSGQAGPAPCSSSASSSSSFTSVPPPSSSPPRTPPPLPAPLRDVRESSPDSQTVDSSCKTPEPSFLADDCPTQTSPTLPPSSPPSPSLPQGSTPTAVQPPSDNAPKSVPSPPSPSSSGAGVLGSLSLPLSSSDPSSSSVSSSSASKPPPPPPPAAPVLPWSLQTGVDCTTGGVLALTALLFKMEEANIASRAKAQEFIQATSQILSQANQSQSQAPSAASLTSSQIPPPPPTLPPPPALSPAQFILQSSLPLVGCTKTPPSHLHPTLGGGCAQTPPPVMPVGLPGFTGSSGDTFWDSESKDPEKYLKKLHTQERAVEEVKLAIKPYYQRKDINKDDYKDILRKAVHKICHSRTGEINPVKVSNLVKLYVQRYKYFRKHGRKMDEEERDEREQSGAF
ncbi:splicing factor, arginine/serine-rich 19 [Hippocampus comes]|uniref:SR-related CTD-associated factor 1 n=1 Tax=Hippocampus comes TaxID=109280 RepID=A0A3Q3DWP9_HIPCM|nr:PREDICTED: splicing factor, arginine/serine-rich 19 [Hippocampus comes]XP_019740375.1 PREDICTED: splicing factor, arginine/serine-rich 19 [Hippocampus comes]XP_019740376.1 PREDICTED: splicing factor, arginine/serine-rich 19 [Hippocampus comes]